MSPARFVISLVGATLVATSALAWLHNGLDTPESSPPVASMLAAWAHGMGGSVPSDALPLGTDANGDPLYGCIAEVTDAAGTQSVQPGELNPKTGGCSVAYGSDERFVHTYEVLVSPRGNRALKLAQVNGTPLPTSSMQVGVDVDGSALYFCVVKRFDGSDEVGHTQAASKECTYAYEGRRHKYDGYKVLVAR